MRLKKIPAQCSDEELMQLVSDGELRAFDELYQRYSKRLMGYFTRMLNFNRGLAEDALQDLFLKIAEHPETFDPSRSFKTWIFSMASNSCKNFYRRRAVVQKNKEQLVWAEENRTNNFFTTLAATIDGGGFRKMLEEALNELPMEKKEAFILKYQEDKSITEIAQIQNCPEGSVKSRLHYTIKVLENKLSIFNPQNQ